MAKKQPAAPDFERDFGYLMPFLDKVAAAAQSATGPVRAELLELLQGEKDRWNRIRALLAGAPGRPASPGDGDPDPAPTFTVGPLKVRR